MAPRPTSPAVPVERFFQFSLLGLVASGYLAVAGSGYLDTATVLLTAFGLLLRGVLICGWLRLEISDRTATRATVLYSAFYALDYFSLSREFLSATVHLVFFLAVVKILTAKTNRDHLYTAVIAFLELVAAAILSVNFNFFLFLALYLLFAMAALTSGEIRRSINNPAAFAARSSVKRFHWRLANLTLTVTAGILLMTAGLFFILPRTADAAFARLISRRMHLPGFSNQVNLGETGEIKNTSRPVMHIRIWGPQQGLKWRGGALVDFDGKRWATTNPVRQPIHVRDGEADLLPPAERAVGRKLNYEVAFDEISTNALFFAGIPESVLRLRVPALYRYEGGGYRLDRSPAPGFHYEAYSLLEDPPETALPQYPPPKLSLEARERYLQLPALDGRIPELAREWTAGFPAELERVRAVERHLRRDYAYTLQLPSREVPDPLAYFLFERRKGHCEYFASAMTVMLRALKIPARLATGFQSGVYNPMTDLWLVRASDAHTWVEAWIPGRGWATFDPTPPDPNQSGFGMMAKLTLYLDAAETFWQQWVMGYDAGQQGSLADRMEHVVRHFGVNWFDSAITLGAGWNTRSLAFVRHHGVRGATVIAFGLALWFFGPPLLRLFRMRQRVERVRRGQASVADATLLYERMLEIAKRHGYQKPVWFTPAEFAASLAGSSIGPPVREFTLAYNALRFGGRTEIAPRLSTLLDELEHQRP